MEHNTLSFYQPQYQPSYLADQQKIDDWLSSTDSLNTPDINPDFFIEANLFKSEKLLSDNKPKDIIDEYAYINNDLTLTGTSTSSNDRSATYSPTYSDKQLQSEAININSPEMMPVSPNKVCPQAEGSYCFEDELYGAQLEYDPFDYASTSGSNCNSRSSSISAGSDHQIFQQYILPASDASVMARIQPAQSPASISSQYSAESPIFTTLDNVQSGGSALDIVQIKQEPTDQYQPTVVAEYETGLTNFNQLPVSSYSTLNPADIATSNYYNPYGGVNSLPSTVTAAVMQAPHHLPQQQQQQQSQSGQSSPTGRKRNANSAFAAAGTSSGSTKKPRMTKREKQKMMESDISKYENENRDLRTSIDLLERQIQFCKRFLSENVAPVIQRQQQQQMHQFGSPQMVVVEGM